MDIKGKPNIFTIVHWDVNSRGIGTYGKYYRIYAYTMDEKGRLIENRSMVDDSAMTGMDGFQEGRESSFPYKTAGAVKSLLNAVTRSASSGLPTCGARCEHRATVRVPFIRVYGSGDA